MSKKIAQTPADPTLPKTPVTIAGKTYNLCLDLGALAEAEAAFIAQGHNVNLLYALPNQNLSNTQVVFAAALRKFHPEITFDEARRLLTIDALYTVALKIQEAWQAATPEVDTTQSPPQPGV